MEFLKNKFILLKENKRLNKYIDMSIWSRVNYNSPKKLAELVRDTGIVTMGVGVCVFCITESVSRFFMLMGI